MLFVWIRVLPVWLVRACERMCGERVCVVNEYVWRTSMCSESLYMCGETSICVGNAVVCVKNAVEVTGSSALMHVLWGI